MDIQIPISVFIDRVNIVQRKAVAMHLDALVVYSSGSSFGFATRTHGYLRYLCDWDALNQAAIMILIPEREPILLVAGESAKLLAREMVWFSDIRSTSQNEFGKEIVNVLRLAPKEYSRVGFIGRSEIPSPLYDTVKDGLKNTEFIDANYLIDELRIVKDSTAIAFHRRAADVCDAMFDALIREIRSGKKVYQIQADLEHVAKFEGCEYASTFLSVGAVADRPRYAKRECSQVPQDGDQVLIAVFVLRDGHWGHAVRTGCMGQANQLQQQVFDIVIEMQEAALQKICRDNQISEIWKASEAVLNKYYPEARYQDWYWLKTGHGIGLDYADPILSDLFPNPYKMGKNKQMKNSDDGEPIRIRPGMLFEIHPNIFVPNKATAAIGDMVLATETGYEILNQFPRELIVF